MSVVLVTGASRGIGAAIADELAALGATVIGTATSDAGHGLTDFEHQRIFGAKYGRHRAGTRWRGILHQLAADSHQMGAIVQRQRAGRDQCAVFAQAMAGQHGRLRRFR